MPNRSATVIPLNKRPQDAVPRSTELGFNEYANTIEDGRVVNSASLVLRGGAVATHNLAIEDVIEFLDEGGVVILRPSVRAEWPRMAAFLAASVFAIYLTVLNPNSFIGIVPMFVFLPLSILAVIMHKRFNSKYTLSKSHVTCVTGLFSWKHSRIRLGYDQLKAIEVEKNVIDRILNTGNIRLSTAMFDQPEVTLKRLHNPQYFAGVVKVKHTAYQPAPDPISSREALKTTMLEEGDG